VQVLLDVHVHVDGGDLLEVDAQFGGSGSCWPTVCSDPANVPGQVCAIASADQPVPSANSTTTSRGCDHSASRSPPMPIACPVTPFAASEARKATTPAASWGEPRLSSRRPYSASGPPVSIASMYGLRKGAVSVIAVMATGTIALTVISARASSIAQVRTMPTMPAFAAA
jgi:hypothetical protein